MFILDVFRVLSGIQSKGSTVVVCPRRYHPAWGTAQARDCPTSQQEQASPVLEKKVCLAIGAQAVPCQVICTREKAVGHIIYRCEVNMLRGLKRKHYPLAYLGNPLQRHNIISTYSCCIWKAVNTSSRMYRVFVWLIVALIRDTAKLPVLPPWSSKMQ